MGQLVIEKIIYKGDNYHYLSKDLQKGIQIIEAENGAGKTTFSSFICYGLGMSVKQFDFRNKKENHTEIYNDTNNYVLLKVLINGEPYEFTRYFNPKNNNVIFIKGRNSEESYFIYRNAVSKESDWIFSDWILNKLGIEVCEIYQGIKKFKINFSDLFRLIHYDQDTNAKKIFKDHRNNNNFVADSNAIRKVIFELLIGYKFSDYYAKVGDYNKTEREKNTYKSTLDNYIDMVGKMGYKIKELNQLELKEKINDFQLQLNKLELYRKTLKTNNYKSTNFDNYIRRLRESLLEINSSYLELRQSKTVTSKELKDLLKLKEEIILESTQIKKIILAHEELNLFSPNTCPSCLKKVNRKENHCICGNPIDESQYEKFFYSSDEYLEILKSKQKSEETIETAIVACEEELDEIENEIIKTETEKNKLNKELYQLEENASSVNNDLELNKVNDQILKIKDEIQTLEQKIKIIDQYENINSNYISSKNKLSKLSQQLNRMEKEVEELMDEQVKKFNEIYEDLLKKADQNVEKAELDEDYMPVVNKGEYRQASSYVPRRFLYYVTLIKMSLDIKKVPFPKFLLIDTPENLGIDEKNLIKCISLLDELYGYDINENTFDNPFLTEPKFQILLTTGLNKYPSKYENLVVETLTEENKLLSKN
ncbi:hypothetical protein ACQ4XT_02765 [Halobacillus faecis]